MEAKPRLKARIRNATQAVLLPDTKVEVHSRPDSPATFDVVVRAGSTDHRFVAGWAGRGWPADVEHILLTAPQVEVVYADKLSEGARARLIERGIGWVDEAGNAVIARPSGLLVSREGREHSSSSAPSQDRWTRTMLAATEAIFAGTTPTVAAVEAATGISRGSAASALSRLEARGHLKRPGKKRGPGVSRTLGNLDAFIDDYAQAAATFRAKQKVVLIHRLGADPLQTLMIDVVPALSAETKQWAVTGAVASTLLAPYLTDVTVVELYVDAQLFAVRDHLASVLGGREVEKGHVMEVRELPTAVSAQGPKIGGVQVALPARVYADLMAAGGRFAEAAQHLREVRGVGPTP